MRLRSSTSATESSMPSCSQERSSQRWQETKITGVPSVRCMASRVTRVLEHRRQEVERDCWVSEPSAGAGTAARDVLTSVLRVRAIGETHKPFHPT